MPDIPTIILTVPCPPSANRMFQRRLTKKGRRNLTPEYKAWRDEAGWLARMQVMGAPPIDCRFNAAIEVPISRKDTDNHIKPLMDLCQLVHVITNDGNMHQVVITPTDRTDCLIALTPLPAMGGVRSAAKVPWRTGGVGKVKPTLAQVRRLAKVRGRVLF